MSTTIKNLKFEFKPIFAICLIEELLQNVKLCALS